MEIIFFDSMGRERHVAEQSVTAQTVTDIVHGMGASGAKLECNRDALWQLYCLHYQGDARAAEVFIVSVATEWCNWYSCSVRDVVEKVIARAERDGDEFELCNWDEFRAVSNQYNWLYKQNHAMKEWFRDRFDGATFTTNRLNMSKLLAGDNYVPAFREKKQKADTRRDANGKGQSSRTPQGASLPTAEQGAILLEQVAGDRETAVASVVQALTAFPDIIGETAVKDALESATKKLAAKQANLLKGRAKQKKRA